MKINVVQFLVFSFASIWVLGDVIGLGYQSRMGAAIITTIVLAYMNDVHGIIIRKLRK